MIRIDHIAAVGAVAAIVVLSIWPLSSGHGDSGGDHGGAVHWGYSGDEGPAHWGDLSADWAACKDGRMQSPIDIVGAFGAQTIGNTMAYEPTPLNIVHNGHTVQVNYQAGSSMTVGGEAYALLQLHFHAPSEHTVGGKAYAMEIHLVHQSASGQLAVVGVMIEEGAESAALADIWANMPMTATPEASHAGTAVDAAAILPDAARYYHYKGSLTTPPCSEGVRWFVLEAPITASAAQIAQFEEAAGPNARPVQPLNERLVIASP